LPLVVIEVKRKIIIQMQIVYRRDDKSFHSNWLDMHIF
jgi:hypothetical protein